MIMHPRIESGARIFVVAALHLLLWSTLAFAIPAASGDLPVMLPLTTPAAARTCKQVSTCEEAVRLWCGGYRRADGDGDGIPCGNVCRTKEQVNAIRVKIGC